MSLSSADVAELRQLLASAVRGKGQVEVIELSHSAFTKSYYLAHQLKDDFQVTLETGETVTVQYAPMTVEKESSGSLLLGDRSITIQQINDLVAREEERIPVSSTEKPVVKVRTFVMRKDGTCSGVASGPYKLFVSSIDYNESNNSCKLTCSTVPTNIAECGEVATIERVPMLAGFA